MSEAIKESIITADGHKYKGELRTFVGVAGLVCDGFGTMYYTNGDVYTGQWRLNKRDGSGTLQYADGSVYEGEWEADRRHGCGQLVFPSQETYEGSFDRDARSGMGTQVLPSGEKYTGSFVDNQRHGRGILDMIDGSTYEGMFKVGFMDGHGTLKLANGDEYVGGFLKSAMHGKGTYTFLTGDCFVGEYENGVRRGGTLSRKGGSEFLAQFSDDGELCKLDETTTGTSITFDPQLGTAVVPAALSTDATSSWNDGEGTIRLASGEVYSGTIKDGARNGRGRLQLANGDCYEGTWVSNQLEGEGKMVLVQQRQLGPHHHGWRYEGTFSQGLFQNFGTLNYDIDGGKYAGHWEGGLRQGLGREEVGEEVYEGEFAADQRHGRGTLTTKLGVFKGLFVEGVLDDDDAEVEYTDGARYRGCARGLRKHGEGRLRYPNGDVYDGEFREDRRHGVGVFTQTNGDVYQGQWQDEQMHGNGCFLYSDGTTYEGRMSKGMKHGAGTLTVGQTGDVFNAVYRNDILEEKTKL